MWTDSTRRQYRRDHLKYASDLTNEEWAVLYPALPRPSKRGRPRKVDLRSIVQAIFYVLEGGCQWRMLPDSFPPRKMVQRYFYIWRNDGTWKRINHLLLMRARERLGREASPSAEVIDGQSAKTTEAGGMRGYDVGKKVKGRKHHIIKDTNGLLVGAVVYGADIQDWNGAPSDPRRLPLAAACLRRWRLYGRQVGGRLGHHGRMDPGDHQAIRHHPGLRRPAQALGGGMHFRLARP